VPSSNYAGAYAVAAHVLIYQGDPEAALRRTQDAIDRDPKYPFFYDYHLGHAHYVWGFKTSAQNPTVARQHFEEAEKHLREAIKKNRNFRPARGYLVAVLSELGRQQEAVSEMATLRNMGERSSDRILPYGDPAIKTHILELWQAAERGARRD